MPSRKPSSSILATGDESIPATGDEVADDDLSPSDALALAEQAEAEADEAEAAAVAARARARAVRLRNQAASRRLPEADEPSDAQAGDGEITESAATDVTTEVTEEPGPTEDIGSEPQAHIPEEQAADTRRRPRIAARHVKLAAGCLVILVIAALLAASSWMVWQHRENQAEQRRTAEFAAAARQGAVTLMSLDYNHAKEDVQRIIDSSTGDFRADFEASAADFTKVAETSKVVTKATVNATAVESMKDDSAVVLVAASSEITNAAGAKQDPRNWRLSVTVVRDGDQLKMSKVEFVP
ncbi:hypothetical protein ACWDTP_06660 [Mycobacterium sp. NPDC003449]